MLNPNQPHVVFPDIKCDTEAAGYKVIVQLRAPRKMVGSIIMPDETQDIEGYRTTIGKVVSIGPGAYADRETGNKWAHPFCKVDDVVRIPEHGGLRWKQKNKDKTDETSFVLLDDTSIMGIVSPEGV